MRWLLWTALLLGLHQEEPRSRLDIRIAFGYKDTRPTRFVGDSYERLFIIKKLLSPCQHRLNQACGFTRDSTDSNRLEKTIYIPNSPRRLQTIITITASAAGPDDEDNRRNPYQKHLSYMAERNFINGLRQANAVIYIGHSRNGGGPSFSPPVLDQKNTVAYDWYQQQRPGLKQMLQALDSASPVKLHLALLSCASSKHFKKSILTKAPEIQLSTVPQLIYFSEALDMTLKKISALIYERVNGSALKTRSPELRRGRNAQKYPVATLNTPSERGKKPSVTQF